MKTLIVGLFMFILWGVPNLAGATPHEDETLPPPGEDGICIPVIPIAECEGPNPPAWCGEYDPEYGDWFVPGEGQGILELLLRGMKHVYTD